MSGWPATAAAMLVVVLLVASFLRAFWRPLVFVVVGVGIGAAVQQLWASVSDAVLRALG